MPINFMNLSSGGASVADWASSPKRHPPRGPRSIIQKFKLRILLGASGTPGRGTGRGDARGATRKRGIDGEGGGEGTEGRHSLARFARRRKTQQKEGSGRCAAARAAGRAEKRLEGRGERRRNEKECNKLAVRLFSTCIKTSSGDGRPGKYWPTPSALSRAPPTLAFHSPLHVPPLGPQSSSFSSSSTSATIPKRKSEAALLRCCSVAPSIGKIMFDLISQRCERGHLNSLTG